MATYRNKKAEHGENVYEIQYLTPYGEWTWCRTEYSRKDADDFLKRLRAGDKQALEDTSYIRDVSRLVIFPLVLIGIVIALMLVGLAAGVH